MHSFYFNAQCYYSKKLILTESAYASKYEIFTDITANLIMRLNKRFLTEIAIWSFTFNYFTQFIFSLFLLVKLVNLFC